MKKAGHKLAALLLAGVLLFSFIPTLVSAQELPWTRVGLEGKSVYQLAIAPSDNLTIYAATGANGVWKSTDGGVSWVEKNNGITLANRNIATIAVDPNNPQIAIAGKPNYGAGQFYRTTDGGSNWVLIIALDTVLLVFEPGSSVFYLSRNDRGLYKSADGGTTWVRKITSNCDVNTIAIDPVNTLTIYVGGFNWGYLSSGGVYKSTNGGSFTPVGPIRTPAVQVNSIAVDPSNSNIIYAAACGTSTGPSPYGLWKSTNGGASWNNIGFSGSEVRHVSVNPLNPQTVYAVKSDSGGWVPYRSEDGGTSWEIFSEGLGHAVACIVADDETPQSVYAGTSSGVYKLTAAVENVPPVAAAGSDQIIEQSSPAGASVTLDGSASSDPDGDPLTYAWTWDGGSATGVKPTVLLPPGKTTVTLVVNDGKVNSSPDTVDITVRDTIPPTTTATVTGTQGLNGWYVSNVTVSLSATDSGSGVKAIYYKLNDGAETEIPGATASVLLTTEGGTIVTYYGRDIAGNAEVARSLTVKIDKTPPDITASATTNGGPYTAGSWTNQDVTVSFGAADAISGIASVTGTITLSSEGAEQSASGTAVDNAGNSASATFGPINIDKTPPTVSISGPSPVLQGASASANWVSSDTGGSGLATPSSGTLPYNTGAAGTYTITVTAIDNASNSDTASLTYTVWGVNGPFAPLVKNGNGTGQFKAGSTIPVKFQLADGGNLITTASGSVAIGTASAPFRWDATAQQYIANIKTASTPGSFDVVLSVNGVGSKTLFSGVTLR